MAPGERKQSLKAAADSEYTMNLYRARKKIPDDFGRFKMHRSPGLLAFAQPSGGVGTSRGSLELNDTLFQVIDATLYQITPNGSTLATFGPIANDGLPVQMAADPDTLVIVGANVLHALNAGVLSRPAMPAGVTPIGICFLKNYFVLLSSSLRQFYFSDDGLIWNPADVQTAEADANNLLAITTHNEELWICGNRITQVFAVGTDPNTPFIQRDGAVIPYGIRARASLRRLGDSLIWLNRDRDSEDEIVKVSGYAEQVISDAAVTNAIRQYSKTATIDDAIGWTYGLNNQEFYCISFPSARGGLGATWQYNATLEEWGEIGSWNATTGLFERHRANTCLSAFGKLLIGDHTNGKIYEMSPDVYDDDGGVARWLWRTPRLGNNGQRVTYNQLEVFGDWGVGLSTGAAEDMDPQMIIRWSNNGGKTFQSERQRSMGLLGTYDRRVTVNQCATGRDRVFEFSSSARTFLGINGVGLDVEVLGR